MSLRFYFGPSDEELCRRVYQEIIEQSLAKEQDKFLIIVPDQFTMQTQKQLVAMHPRGGILNIDVLSFERLHYRVMEELGQESKPVLDDTGKSLVLQKVAAGLKEKCPVLGGFLSRQGYIHEMKSMISEFMQYGIGDKELESLEDFSMGRGALVGKLKDLHTVYKGFREYIKDHFIPTEEVLDVLRCNLPKSQIVRDSVIVLNGFTGFTPVQIRLVEELLKVGREVIVTLVLGEEENPYMMKGEQELFYLTKRTVEQLETMAWDQEIKRDRTKDIFCSFQTTGTQMRFLAENLFRYDAKSCETCDGQLVLFETLSSKGEIRQIASYIEKLTLEEGYAYRDIAVILGNPEESAPFVEQEFSRLQIPHFIDASRALRLNPLVEFIKSALQLFLKDFSYDAVMHYLKTGMTDFTREEVDLLDNYLLATGIRGQRKWKRQFVTKTQDMGEEELEQLQSLQKRFMESLVPLQSVKEEKANVLVEQLYCFLTSLKVQDKMKRLEREFEAKQDFVKVKEYSQMYRLIMELLEQIHQLLGEEVLTWKEFSELLEAGFGEIQVGVLPKQVDRVLVGDMQRTRLRDVKVLFFAGVNDLNIPRSASKGGIISDMDREFLQQSGVELAPTPRQQMYIQRFYLYLNMTKPTERLYLSYGRIGADGKSRRPSYLFGEVQKLFPGLAISHPEEAALTERIQTKEEGLELLAEQLRDYAQGILSPDKTADLFALYDAVEDEARKGRYEEAAFLEYKDRRIPKLVALALYGHTLAGSVTRFEKYAGCAYQYFLQYGLKLSQREEFGLENYDYGTIYHAVLDAFSRGLTENKRNWENFDEAYAKAEIHRCLETISTTYGAAVLYSSHQYMYALEQMEKVLLRSVMTIQYQLKKGSFEPKEYELAFQHIGELNGESLRLSEDERIYLNGKIDRLDTVQEENKLYVKILDYKSSEHKFDLVGLYHGLSLQLIVYMKYALDDQKRKHPDKEVEPAAMLYYQMADPWIDCKEELPQEEIREKIFAELKTSGIVNESQAVLNSLDRDLEQGNSTVIPVGKKKDGSLSATSKVFTREEFEILSQYATKKIKSLGGEILDGNIRLQPYERDKKSACEYCPFQAVCGFDKAIPGCKPRVLSAMEEEEVLNKMKEQ